MDSTEGPSAVTDDKVMMLAQMVGDLRRDLQALTLRVAALEKREQA